MTRAIAVAVLRVLLVLACAGCVVAAAWMFDYRLGLCVAGLSGLLLVRDAATMKPQGGGP